jgi:hypothetical protein
MESSSSFLPPLKLYFSPFLLHTKVTGSLYTLPAAVPTQVDERGRGTSPNKLMRIGSNQPSIIFSRRPFRRR